MYRVKERILKIKVKTGHKYCSDGLYACENLAKKIIPNTMYVMYICKLFPETYREFTHLSLTDSKPKRCEKCLKGENKKNEKNTKGKN